MKLNVFYWHQGKAKPIFHNLSKSAIITCSIYDVKYDVNLHSYHFCLFFDDATWISKNVERNFDLSWIFD